MASSKQSGSQQQASHQGRVSTAAFVTEQETLGSCTHAYVFIIHRLKKKDLCTLSYLYEYYRWTYQEFFRRYRVLMKQKDVLSDRKQTCKNVLEKLIQVCLNTVFPQCNFHRPTQIFHFIYATVLCFAPRTRINISLAKTRSSSGPVRWPTWRSCVLTSCVWLAFASRRLFAAGWLAKST